MSPGVGLHEPGAIQGFGSLWGFMSLKAGGRYYYTQIRAMMED